MLVGSSYANNITLDSKSNYSLTSQIMLAKHPFPQNIIYTLSDGTPALFPAGTNKSKNSTIQNYYLAWKNLYEFMPGITTYVKDFNK